MFNDESRVRIITSLKGFDLLKKYVEEHIDTTKGINLLDDLDCDFPNSKFHYFGWNFLEWGNYNYSSKIILDGLDYLRENDLSYRWVRLGYEIGDGEEDFFDGSEEDDLEGIQVTITFEDDDYEMWDEIERDRLL